MLQSHIIAAAIGAAIGLLAGVASFAQSVTLPEPDRESAFIDIENQLTSPVEQTRVIKTEAGDVTIRYTSTPNSPPETAGDIVEVIDVPPGYVAVPYSLTIPEGDTGRIEIRPFAGM